tara:strand:+ start:459 stop:1046 length:588 start_codon:yes stop_codon:yes gene_type:complete
MSEIQANKLSPASGTALQVGDSGDTITIPSGATITNNGTQTGFGGSNENSFMAYNNGSQLLNQDTWTTIEYNAETFDLNSKFDTSTYRYTPASTGYYFLHAVVQFNFNDGSLGRRANLRLQKNGSDIAYAYQRFADSGFDALNVHSMSITWVDYSSSASDYYTLQAQQNNANGNNNCYAITGASSTYFTGYKLIT